MISNWIQTLTQKPRLGNVFALARTLNCCKSDRICGVATASEFFLEHGM